MFQTVGRPVNPTTSLPPGIPGPPTAFLLLQVSLFRSTLRRPVVLLQRLAVRAVWWGEESSGVVLHPRIHGRQKTTQMQHRCHTRYPICVPLRKMQIYLEGS